MAIFFAGLAGIIHIYVFCLESFLWGKPNTNRVFKISLELAEQNRIIAFNQGFYNLFLAGAALSGIFIGIDSSAGKALVVFSLISMMLAAVVLIVSKRDLLRPALIQGVPPLLGLVFLALG